MIHEIPMGENARVDVEHIRIVHGQGVIEESCIAGSEGVVAEEFDVPNRWHHGVVGEHFHLWRSRVAHRGHRGRLGEVDHRLGERIGHGGREGGGRRLGAFRHLVVLLPPVVLGPRVGPPVSLFHVLLHVAVSPGDVGAIFELALVEGGVRAMLVVPVPLVLFRGRPANLVVLASGVGALVRPLMGLLMFPA